ncbi:MAG TPA: polymer-forming cytoskeletal protein [Flavisolibacter sp.]|jgi:cytoskeletal protein CcmA (bactofilin family)|nr:polymer-forming cytoskeletal protein [Flavisolibacter sp.]
MFHKEKNLSISEKVSNSATLISEGTLLQGDLNSENDLRIDGTIQGNIISSAKVVIGPTGRVEGNIHGRQADITGKVIGNIAVQEILQLRGDCNVQGNINAATLQIDPTAVFNGQCQMGGVQAANVVLMNTMDGQTAEAK